MNAVSSFEKFLEGEYSPVECGSERDYRALWDERGMQRLEPAASAIAGGLLADRLPWVFTAGYQATLRNAFPSLPRDGWAAFAATEDTHDPQAHPGTVLIEDGETYRLNGHKSWVAHSALVDYLIVTVNDPGGDKRRARGLIVERSRAGVTLTHRTEPGFLKALSQGFAKFDNAAVAATEVFEFEPIRQFGRTEAKFVMLAGTAFMLARAEEARELHDRLLACGLALLSILSEQDTSRQVYGAVDREFQRCVDRFEQKIDTSAIADYAADRRLFRMYTDRIQRRVAYARQELG